MSYFDIASERPCVDNVSKLEHLHRYLTVGPTISQLPFFLMQFPPVFYGAEFGHRYHSLRGLVCSFLRLRLLLLLLLNCVVLTMFVLFICRAGIGPVYDPTCGSSGPTGLCVRPTVSIPSQAISTSVSLQYFFVHLYVRTLVRR